MNRSTPGLPGHHQLPKFTQTHAHWVGDAIQPFYPLLSSSPPAPIPSQHQGLFQRVNSSHEVAKVLEFQLQHQSFQWTSRTDLLQDGLVGSFCSPRDSQESSPTPQFKMSHQDSPESCVCVCVCVKLLSCVWLFVTPWTIVCQASLSLTISWNLLKFMPIEWWCHPTISSSVASSSCPQSFPASGSFPMSWLFTSGAQSIGTSASVLPMNIQGWFSSGLTGMISLQESFPAPQFENINPLVLSLLYGPTLISAHDYWENHNFDYMDLCFQSDVFAF